jgi:hypothetical protein
MNSTDIDAAQLNLDVLMALADVSLMALKRGMQPTELARVALDFATDVLEAGRVGDAQARRQWLASELQKRIAEAEL